MPGLQAWATTFSVELHFKNQTSFLAPSFHSPTTEHSDHGAHRPQGTQVLWPRPRFSYLAKASEQNGLLASLSPQGSTLSSWHGSHAFLPVFSCPSGHCYLLSFEDAASQGPCPAFLLPCYKARSLITSTPPKPSCYCRVLFLAQMSLLNS